jgi:uroporphyrinogen-III decarboxylase
MTNIYENLSQNTPWYCFFAIESYMKALNIELTVENQIKALLNYQKDYNFDLIFPRMDLDEYVDFISKVKTKKEIISKSKDWVNFSPEQIFNTPDMPQISNSSTYQVLKAIRDYRNSGNTFKYIGGFIPAPYTLVSLVLDLQTVSELVIFEPEFLRKMVEFTTPIIKQYAKVLSNYIDTFFILAPSECTIMKKSYINLVQKSMNQLIHYCVSKLNIPTIMHMCTTKNKNIVNDEVIKPMKKAGICGLNIPNIIENTPLAQKYDLILCGGIDPVQIQLEPFENTFEKISSLLRKIKSNKFILATNCQIKWAPDQISSEELINLFFKLQSIAKN